MKVAFRADASVTIGSGHVMRCATLAGQLQARGVEVFFICRDLQGHYNDWLIARGFRVLRLPAPVSVQQRLEVGSAHAAWLEVGLESEITDCHIALGGLAPIDWLVVDHYALDITWERVMRKYARRILVVDDLADRPHDCDLLLDQNLQPKAGRYDPLVPSRCNKLLGPYFALLRDEFISKREVRVERTGNIRRVLVFAGGSDPGNLTGKILDALQRVNLCGVAIDVVVGQSNPHLDEIKLRCEAVLGCNLHVQTSDMADLMACADVMLGGVGGSTWERCCLGLPAILASIADNQREIGRQAARARTALYLGDADDLAPEDLANALAGLMRRPGLVRRMGRRGRSLVDGRGASRVVAGLLGRLRLVVVSDADSWLNPYLDDLVSGWRRDGHEVQWLHDPDALPAGDCAFFLSVGRIIKTELLARHVHNLVVHESDLPKGRGWSPLSWQILEGVNRIPVTLFEAAQAVDSGPIFLQKHLDFSGHELVDELRSAQAAATVTLCRQFVARYPAICAESRPQHGEPSYYPRRHPKDSRLDPDRTLREQFNLLRVADNDRYPAYFDLEGQRYIVRVEKLKS